MASQAKGETDVMLEAEDLTLEEDEEWELEEGIPQFSDTFIQKYFTGRDALIAQENKHRSGA